ncbi:hypothetical protein [Acetobacter sp. DsW_063]|uniref:hypothetical protein n=1 Tax=Acetobacter sp. DsW_063 TaxID=1514894 RepID=UPI000A37AB71|nr:hypothetical protein [Acetobacter sp. DsW_063]OUJ16303.1 hypothetical protein HK28_01425 [Acetobacter sp. DsW_063]
MAGDDFSPGIDDGRSADSDRITVEDRYVIDATRRLPDLAGCPAYAVKDALSAQATLVALAPPAFQPARAEASQMARVRSPHLLAAHVVDETSGSVWIICDAPTGAPLSQNTAWSESALLERVIQPIAAVLHAYNAAGITHRAIRPDNVFDPGGRAPVKLGPGLAAPPAFLQPGQFEPLSSLLCSPAARGAGTIADDVFSLGALAAWLLGGGGGLQSPIYSDADIEERIVRGSFDVLAGHLSLSPEVAALLAAMLADDPDARPSPTDLLNASERKAFTARKQVSAGAPIRIGSAQVRTTRALAWHGARNPVALANLVRRGVIERWLTHELGLTAVAARMTAIGKELTITEDAAPSPPVLMEIIAALDPGLPLHWQGEWFWVDAIGMIATSSLVPGGGQVAPEFPRLILEAAQGGALLRFAQATSIASQNVAAQTVHAALHHGRVERVADIGRLAYLLNPGQACLSSDCAGKRLSAAWALLQWLNGEFTPTNSATRGLLDRQMTAFLLARGHRSGLIEQLGNESGDGHSPWLKDLALLAQMQSRYQAGPLLGIARKILPHLTPALKLWRNRTTRTRRGENLAAAAESGDLTRMAEIIADPRSVAKDRSDWLVAQNEMRRLTQEQIDLGKKLPDVPPMLRAEMLQVATALGALAAIGSLCLEVIS